jgi:OmpA-OmpF porin, OOP family
MRYLILMAVMLGIASPVFSQNNEFPRAIHFKINLMDYGSLYNKTARYGQGFEVGYFRHLAPFLNVGVPFKMAVAKLPLISDNTVTTSLDAVFHLGNMRDNAKISPYLIGGVGAFMEAFDPEKSDLHFPFGAGVNVRISKYAFINLQGEFRKAMADNRDNLQIGAGFVYLLHKSDELLIPPPPLDTDHDSIPDVADRCPDVKGPASALGCPDTDGDGLGDVEDQCPTQSGSIETLGCPDTDKDGIADKNDDCPTEAGIINGCPDSDKDGFADNKDECPTLAGRWNGCPDTDFDGIADKDDQCPNDPGSKENKGCPQKKDQDGDGFDDLEDKCPTLAGTLMGCPDADNDGVEDALDQCPSLAGKINGCPDTDGDGITDNNDKCPTTAAAGTTNGCPEVKQEVKERLAFATKAVQFETGKATLKVQSYAVLDELYGILKQYPDYKLSASGHTDDIGDDQQNLLLSEARAKSCQEYLILRGMNPSRMRYTGYGEMRPIAANTTQAGRDMNRRVEFELVVD